MMKIYRSEATVADDFVRASVGTVGLSRFVVNVLSHTYTFLDLSIIAL